MTATHQHTSITTATLTLAASLAVLPLATPATADARPHKCRDSADGQSMICELPDHPGHSYTVPLPAVPTAERSAPSRPTPGFTRDPDRPTITVPTREPTTAPGSHTGDTSDTGGGGVSGALVLFIVLLGAAGGGYAIWRVRQGTTGPAGPAHTRGGAAQTSYVPSDDDDDDWDDDDEDWDGDAGVPAVPAQPVAPAAPAPPSRPSGTGSSGGDLWGS